MAVIHALIQHCHDDGRFTGGELPGFLHVHVRSREELARAQRALVDEVPLVGEEFVVERSRCCLAYGIEAGFERRCLARVRALEAAVVFYPVDFSESGKLSCQIPAVGVLIEADQVPEVESFLARACLAA